MKKIWFASTNLGKINEVKNYLQKIEIKTILDYDKNLDIPEDYLTFVENAKTKAKTFFELVNEPVLADDSGLSIENLNGFPGVHSARWAKPEVDWKVINQKLLDILQENKLIKPEQRKAFFTTVLVYYDGKDYMVFEGVVNGIITNELKGENGFGYSPIFKPNNSNLTHAEMTADQKLLSSHRHIALEKFKNWIEKENK